MVMTRGVGVRYAPSRGCCGSVVSPCRRTTSARRSGRSTSLRPSTPRRRAAPPGRPIDSLQDKRRLPNQHQIAFRKGQNSAFHGLLQGSEGHLPYSATSLLTTRIKNAIRLMGCHRAPIARVRAPLSFPRCVTLVFISVPSRQPLFGIVRTLAPKAPQGSASPTTALALPIVQRTLLLRNRISTHVHRDHGRHNGVRNMIVSG